MEWRNPKKIPIVVHSGCLVLGTGYSLLFLQTGLSTESRYALLALLPFIGFPHLIWQIREESKDHEKCLKRYDNSIWKMWSVRLSLMGIGGLLYFFAGMLLLVLMFWIYYFSQGV
jgi:hypothetical protein